MASHPVPVDLISVIWPYYAIVCSAIAIWIAGSQIVLFGPLEHGESTVH